VAEPQFSPLRLRPGRDDNSSCWAEDFSLRFLPS
jgi:hypothetical protein